MSDSGLYQLLDVQGRLVEGAAAPALSDARLVEMYQWMLATRTVDARLVNLQRQGRVAFYGSIMGQEAATIASGMAAEACDWIFPALREGALSVVRGLSMEKAVAQFYGTALDDCKGRQMPCHPSFVSGHYVSMSSVIGTQIPQAVGAAMAAKMRRDPAVMLAYMGDGATSEPDFAAAMNFAAVYKAPVVLICQNNQWAISVPASKQSVSLTFAVKARAFGMEGVRVDGNDALAVYAATRRAVEKARRGEGPTFLELVTYRLLGHTTSDDPTRYRNESEVEIWRQRDPLPRLRAFLTARGLWSDERDVAFVEQLTAEVQRAVEVAEQTPPPSVDSMFDDVYSTLPPHLREQRAELEAFMRSTQHG